MTGDPKFFLKWNKDEIFKGLIAIENHFRYLRSGDYGCILKHLAEVEGHCDEAISHSAELGLEEMCKKFRELRDLVKEFREKLKDLSPTEGIKKIRELRKFFESFNPEYAVVCRCGEPIDVAKARLQLEKALEAPVLHNYDEIEKEYAEKILDMLSKEYKVPKPKLVILDNCPQEEPAVFGEFRVSEKSKEPEIVLCKSGVDLHKIFHEWYHYLQYLNKKPLNEIDAECFALNKANGGTVEACHGKKYNYKAVAIAGACLAGLTYSIIKKNWIATSLLAGIFLIAIASYK